MSHRILLLTGMTPDRRIFDRILPLLPTAVVVDWIQPMRHESIRDYASRLGQSIPKDNSTLVCGVSFGGIVACELASSINAKACVLISSVRSPEELPPWFRAFRVLTPCTAEMGMQTIGAMSSFWPHRLRTPTTWRFLKFAGTSGAWHRWATAAVLNWKPFNDDNPIPVFQIHGDRDSTFPIRYIDADYVVQGGGHVLPLTHGKEVAEKLSQIAA
jgi:pimeloyl-ACP methyl ester carboxylesterase